MVWVVVMVLVGCEELGGLGLVGCGCLYFLGEVWLGRLLVWWVL